MDGKDFTGDNTSPLIKGESTNTEVMQAKTNIKRMLAAVKAGLPEEVKQGETWLHRGDGRNFVNGSGRFARLVVLANGLEVKLMLFDPSHPKSDKTGFHSERVEMTDTQEIVNRLKAAYGIRAKTHRHARGNSAVREAMRQIVEEEASSLHDASSQNSNEEEI